MSAKKEKLMVIDGNALIHRSFHALPATMATKAGEITNAVYGFTTVLLKALREFKPDYVVLTLDKGGKTFRHEEYKEYKATRAKAPDELYAQIPRVKEMAQAFDIPIYEKEGLEADDLIGTIVSHVDGNVDKIIVTGDLDTLQLVNNHTKVFTMSRGLSDSVLYDETAVKNRYGLPPERMIDFKALNGDPSDNIPGVRGIGEKTATELLKKFRTLENLYKYTNNQQQTTNNKIKPRIIELLKKYKGDAVLSKRLATIKRDAKINFDLTEARFGQFNREKIIKLFSELEFKSLLPRIQELGKREEGKGKREKGEWEKGEFENKLERNKKLFKYHLIDDDKKFNSFLEKLKKQKMFAIDTETSSLDPITADLLGISFSWKEGEASFAQIRNSPSSRAQAEGKFEIRNLGKDLFSYKNNTQTKNINRGWLEKLKPILENKKIKKCGHNIKFDISVMANNGISVAGIAFDTMVASYLLNPGSRQHNLDAVTFSEFGFEKITKNDLLGTGRGKKSFSEVEIKKLSLYSCEDADFTFRLVGKLGKELEERELKKLFETIEMPLIPVLAEMENNGIKLDTIFLGKLNKKVGQKIKELKKKIKKMAGMDFNLNSTQQLREVLFEKLEIPAHEVARTKTGLSTAADELAKLKEYHPIIPLIQEYRELAKLMNTYIDTLPQLVNAKTGRLHTSFNQTITATGRLSSSEPNLQNIPIRTELGKEIRKAFAADEGFKLLSLDYSQIELRLAAHLSGDAKMIKAFKEGKDIHTATAAEINNVPLVEVTSTMRREAKAINFGIIYGQGPHGLSRTAEISYERARKFIEKYFKAHKNIKKYINELIERARKKGYAQTLFGRKRYLPEINSSIAQIRKAAERMAINMPLQGTAADMIKAAMIRITPLIKGVGGIKNEARMLLQVHDELLFEIKESEVKKWTPKIKQAMESRVLGIKLKVPIVVDVSTGDNWGEMEETRSKKLEVKS